MATSLGLSLWLIATSRGAEGAGRVLPPPPAAPLIWLHAPSGGTSLAVLAALSRRLATLRPRLGVVLTHPPGAAPGPGSVPPRTLLLPALPEDPALMRRAMELWQPGAVVLGDGPLSPALIHAAEQAGRHAFLIDATEPRVEARWSALPGLQRALLRRLRRILVRDATAARAFRRAGARPWRLEQAGSMGLCAGPLLHNAVERDALAQRIGARPLWLAVTVPEAEEGAVLVAHRAAQMLAHRLLLLLVPSDPARGPALVEAAAALGLQASRRSAEQEPSDDDQIYVADTEGELGLWYRLAPVTFLGGTLIPGATARDPLEAASLGSAVVHGPATGPHAEACDRLMRAGASWRVPGGTGAAATEALTEAMVTLLAPDRVAQMAQAGWAVATEGTEVTDHVASLVLAALDEPPAPTVSA